jgi:hypothetical protein
LTALRKKTKNCGGIVLEFALKYAAAGFHVFPVKARGKIPLTPNGSHDATTVETTIREWWAKWPDANIGMTLGGLVVVDIDPRNGGDAQALPHPLPDTCFAKTGGGGWHYLYRTTEGVRYNAHPAQGIDVKSGAGAYIVVEPSIHESGQSYCWLDESEPWAMKPAFAPWWLAQHKQAPAQAPTGAYIPSGRRNEALAGMAGAMRRKGMSAEAIEAALLAENRRCSPPLDEDEVRRIAGSVSRYAPAEDPTTVDDERPEVISPEDVADELLAVYDNGLGRGDSAGWPSVDKLLSIAPGQLTTVTGFPNSGKSQWLDALAINLSRQGWKFVFCSLENIPVYLHVEKLAKQASGKPVRHGPTERIEREELRETIKGLNQWARFVLPAEKKANPSLADVLEVIEAEFQRQGLTKDDKRACVIDPWNELEHVRPQGMSLTEYIGASLSIIRQWARRQMLHVFLVGHPAKQYRNRETAKLPVATPDMISDSAHFWNKSDICITVALTDEHRSQEVDIHIQKMRFAHIGQRGTATLIYDKTTGKYHEPPAELAVISGKGRGRVDF